MRQLCRIGAITLLICSIANAEESDLAGARAVFDQNIAAIRNRDRAGYLSLYLQSDRLIRGGPTGFSLGYEDFAKQAGARWPDTIEASEIRLTALQPGVVYGTYRYRVRYGAEEHSGISERLFVKTANGWKIALTGAIDAPAGTPAPPRAITGATLIDGRGGAPLPNANVILRDGKIDCAGTAAQCPVPEGIDRLDARGMWITPGLIDAHVHFSQTGWADGRPDALDVRASYPYEKTQADLRVHPERFGRSHLCSGITSVFDVGGYPWTLSLRERYASDSAMPHVAAAGPLLSTLDHWVNLPAERQFIHIKDPESARNAVRYLASHGSSAVKIWYIVRGPELSVEASAATVTAAGEEARKQGIPLIVHATGLGEAKLALRAGARLLVHSVDDVTIDQEFIDLARKNGTIVVPTLTVIDGYLRMNRSAISRQAPVVDDPNGCVDRVTLAKVAETANVEPSAINSERVAALERRAERFTRLTRRNLKLLVDTGIPIATGTDAGNPLTLHGPAIYAEMEAMQASGMKPMQVILSSTAVAARAMGLDKITGTVEKGRDADLVLLGADPTVDVANFRKVRYVVRAGVARSIEELSAMAR